MPRPPGAASSMQSAEQGEPQRVHRSQFEAAPHDKADFERFLALEWNDEVCARAGGRRRMADPDEAPPSMAGMRRNLFFVGA